MSFSIGTHDTRGLLTYSYFTVPARSNTKYPYSYYWNELIKDTTPVTQEIKERSTDLSVCVCVRRRRRRTTCRWSAASGCTRTWRSRPWRAGCGHTLPSRAAPASSPPPTRERRTPPASSAPSRPASPRLAPPLGTLATHHRLSKVIRATRPSIWRHTPHTNYV